MMRPVMRSFLLADGGRGMWTRLQSLLPAIILRKAGHSQIESRYLGGREASENSCKKLPD